MHFTSVFLNIYKRVVQLSMMGDTFLKKIVSLLTFFVKVDGSFFYSHFHSFNAVTLYGFSVTNNEIARIKIKKI